MDNDKFKQEYQEYLRRNPGLVSTPVADTIVKCVVVVVTIATILRIWGIL